MELTNFTVELENLLLEGGIIFRAGLFQGVRIGTGMSLIKSFVLQHYICICTRVAAILLTPY